VDTGDGGPATSAALSNVNAVASDSAGNLFIAESFAIRRVDARTGIITTIAREGGQGIAVDRLGYVYIANSNSDKVRKLDPSTGTIVDFAGNGQLGSTGDNGPATQASLYLPQTPYLPQALAFDNDGNLLIADSPGVRKVNVGSGIITTYVKTYDAPSISVDAAGDLYLSGGDLELVPAGPGTPRFVETQSLSYLLDPILRDPAGTFYTSNGTTLSPTLPSPYQMPSAIVNGKSSAAKIEIANAGNMPVGIGTVTLTGANAAELSQTNTCSQNIGPSQSCAVNLAFSPAQTGTLTASLVIASTLSNLQTTVTAAGEVPSIQYTPQSFAFGNVPIWSNPLSQSIYILNAVVPWSDTKS
jgi:hypothetical protein